MTRLTTIGLALCLMAGFSPLAAATDFNEDGNVDVYAALTVFETIEIDFGTVTDNDGTITLDLADTINDPSGIYVASDPATTGDYLLGGESGQTVAIVLTGSTTNGLTIGNFTTSEADLNNVTLTGGSISLLIGADLTVASGTATAGPNQPLNFTIGITYN